MNEEDAFIHRIMDLADRNYKRGQYTYSGFLSSDRQALILQMSESLSFVPWEMNGGMPMSERKMIRFGSTEQLGYDEDFPIICIAAEPLTEKFAENLTHRDYLGALMGLGIVRDVIGDIILQEKSAYIFCEEKMAGYIVENLDKVRRTPVRCRVEKNAISDAGVSLNSEELVVSSNRCDSILSKAFGLSRHNASSLLRAGKVMINGRLAMSCSTELKSGDVVSVRGYGKFVFAEVLLETKKGKYRVLIKKYV